MKIIGRFAWILLLLFMASTLNFTEGYQDEDQSFHPREARLYAFDNQLSAFETMDAFEDNIRHFMKAWGLKGASVAIMKEGELKYAKGFGFAEEEKGKRMNASSMFRLASVSKLITAVAVMKLIEHNKIHLDDKVFGKEGILSDTMFLDYTDEDVEKITIQHLLTHKGGWDKRKGDPMFQSVYIANQMEVDAPPSIDQVLQYVLNERSLRYQPGTKSEYSNFGYVVLGEVIEKVSGMAYEDYVQRVVLRPLNIWDIRPAKNFYEEKYFNEVKYYDNYSRVYSCYGTGKLVDIPYGGSDIEALSAAGGWVGSAPSLLKLMAALDQHDEYPDLLDSSTIELMKKVDHDNKFPIGWQGAQEKYWWRGGYLAGSTVIMMHQFDGYNWVMMTNTSTWKESNFTANMNYIMQKSIMMNKNELPECNLFDYDLPFKISEIDFLGVANRSSLTQLTYHERRHGLN